MAAIDKLAQQSGLQGALKSPNPVQGQMVDRVRQGQVPVLPEPLQQSLIFQRSLPPSAQVVHTPADALKQAQDFENRRRLILESLARDQAARKGKK